MKYKLVIFDLDGTLADTLDDIADITNDVLHRMGYPSHDKDSYRYFVGNGLRNLVKVCLPENDRTETKIEECFREVLNNYENNCINKTKLYNGIPELLTQLTAKDIKMAILSNKADSITRKISDKLFSEWNFQIIMGSDDHFPPKPDPSSALYIAQKLNVLPGNVLYVGDSNVDMQTAVSSGFHSVGVTWGFRSKKELIDNGADYTIDDPIDLLDIINENED